MTDTMRRNTAERWAVYTCITGGYDRLIEPSHQDPNLDYFLVSDTPPPAGSAWSYIPLPQPDYPPAMANRYAKMFPHKLFPDHDCSLYIDGTIAITDSLAPLTGSALQQHNIAAYQHFARCCAYQEGLSCAATGHAWLHDIKKQLSRYRATGLPANYGLFECNILLRRHSSESIQQAMEDWWGEYTQGVKRDQLSFTYSLYRNKVTAKNLGESDARFANHYFLHSLTHASSLPLAARLRGTLNRKYMRFMNVDYY